MTSSGCDYFGTMLPVGDSCYTDGSSKEWVAHCASDGATVTWDDAACNGPCIDAGGGIAYCSS
jgi:hypothetical protein